jgi:flagellin
LSLDENLSQAIVGSAVYTFANGTYTSLDVTVASVNGTNVTLSGNATWADNATIVFSGQLTQKLSSTSGDLSLRQAVDASALQDSTASTATAAFQMVQRAANAYVVALGTQRSQLGAYQNQMEYTLSNITELSSNLQSARSRVIDTDYASETAALTKGQILQQAATAMLAQANQMPNVILTLLK